MLCFIALPTLTGRVHGLSTQVYQFFACSTGKLLPCNLQQSWLAPGVVSLNRLFIWPTHFSDASAARGEDDVDGPASVTRDEE